MANTTEKIESESTAEEQHHEIEEDDDDPKGSKIVNFLQKPFDFINMMFQFIIYFMVKMVSGFAWELN